MEEYNTSGGVEFEIEKIPTQTQVRSFEATTPKITSWVVKYSRGYIKDEIHANYFLFGLVVFVIIISSILFFRKNDEAKIVAPFGNIVLYLPHTPPRLQNPQN